LIGLDSIGAEQRKQDPTAVVTTKVKGVAGKKLSTAMLILLVGLLGGFVVTFVWVGNYKASQAAQRKAELERPTRIPEWFREWNRPIEEPARRQ
jgi:hypothetical protein